ncbi:glycosyltransferase [Rhodococcus rhodochrous]|nr:glycosyltransferase [Rhodococcus rhodochrous]
MSMGMATRKIWGPVAIPNQPIINQRGNASVREEGSVKLSRLLGSGFVRSQDVCLAQNDHTYQFCRKFAAEVRIEPNVVVECMPASPRDIGQLVFSGNLIMRKRPWLCLKLLKEADMNDFRLVVIGDGPLRGAMESFVRQERLESRVRFLGRLPRDEALRVVARSGALLLPSSREGAPWVVGEAAAMGVPSVVSELSGAQTVVRLSGDMGSVAQEGSSEEETTRNLANAVLSTVAVDSWTPTDRWSAARLEPLLDELWRS